MQTTQVEGPIEAPTNPDYPPACNWLRVNSFFGLSPSWRWGIGVMTVTAAQGEPGDDDYVAEQRDFRELVAGNDAMTPEQWQAWTDQATDPYVLECAAANLGLTLAPSQQAKTGTKKSAVKRSSKKS